MVSPEFLSRELLNHWESLLSANGSGVEISKFRFLHFE